jgi:signal transduction histidine kinase
MHDVDRAGLGLISMRERVGFLGGEVAIHSSPGHGVRIEACVPLHAGAPSEAAGFL